MELRKNAEKRIKEILETVQNSGFSASGIEQKKYNFEFSAQKNNCNNKVQVFFGKKGIKTVLQGNNGSIEYSELKNIISDNLSFQFNEIENSNFKEYIGTDESGKGDFFGPLVIAGFYFEEKIMDYLIKAEVKDSKELSDYSINRIATQIINNFPRNYHVMSIEPEEYNIIYSKLKNINQILDWAHSEVIKTLFNLNKTSTVIVDQFSKREISVQFSKELSGVEFLQIPKAEKYLGVAAASIIARSHFNKWFDKMESMNLNLPKGASSAVETAARSLVSKIGKDKLGQYAKLHFKTLNKIAAE